jgi:uncharacterized Fe-S cluster-containing radical SAM superfamily protein
MPSEVGIQRHPHSAILAIPTDLGRSEFYNDVYTNGCYTADIMGCNWTCQHCWSAYGWEGALRNAGMEPRFKLDPAEVAVKLIRGMKNNAQSMCRISGGEATMYWDHTVELIAEFLKRTEGVRFHMPPITEARGEPLGIIIETNGSMLDKKRIDDLEERFGEQAQRVVLSIGFKATHPEALAELTGLPLKVAATAHQKQMDALLYIALEAKYLDFWASFLDRYTDPGIYAALQREVERARSGAGRNFAIQPFKSYGDANRLWTPKRFRGRSMKEPSPERDEEIITQFIDADGGTASFDELEAQIVADLEKVKAGPGDAERQEELEEELLELMETRPSQTMVPVERPDDDELLNIQLGFTDAVDQQGFADGAVK